MADDSNENLFALLIGIDYYPEGTEFEGRRFPNLEGAVNDITRVETFLRERIKLPDDHLIKLTATDSGVMGAFEPPEKLPTRKNMIAAFQRLTEMAHPNSQVYIHYAGHGGRAATAFPKIKSATGRDEGLVPTDIAQPGSNYIRDLELACLLKRMTDKGLLVTLILDSCHAGGGERGNKTARVRGRPEVDQRARPLDGLVGSVEEIEQFWLNEQKATSPSGWLNTQQRVLLLAACRASESAYEDVFEEKQKFGALSYWMLDSLLHADAEYTYRQLYERVLGKVQTRFMNQTPQLEGDGTRAIFGNEHFKKKFAVTVMDVDLQARQARLNIGRTGMVGDGALFAVYAADAQAYVEKNRLALATLTQVGTTDSLAKLSEIPQPVASIDAGAQAVLLYAGKINLSRKFGFIERDDLPPAVSQTDAFALVRQALEKHRAGAELKRRASLIELVQENESPDFQIALNERGLYEFCDAAGELLANVSPLPVDAVNARRVVERLEHLTKFYNVLRLENRDAQSELIGKLELKLGTLPSNIPMGQTEIELLPLPDATTPPTISDQQDFALQIYNRSKDHELNFAVFCLAADWSITQVEFSPTESGVMSIESRTTRTSQALSFDLPRKSSSGTYILKVIATMDPSTSFGWLELSGLDESERVYRGEKPADELEALFDSVARGRTRSIIPTRPSTRDWVTAQVQLHAVRA